MPPFFHDVVSRALASQPGNISSELRSQWTNPGDVFSLLLIVGGDVVARGLAQSTGWLIGPPSFSFGWVAYAVNALVAAAGENKLMPEPDYSCLVINGKSGYVRENKSWILGRMARDYEAWMDQSIRDNARHIIEEKWAQLKRDAQAKKLPEPTRPAQAGLCISIYQPNQTGKVAAPSDKWLWIQSIVVAAVQLALAAVPCGLFGDWAILMITACGIALSMATASLAQWRKEKWACRLQQEGKEKIYILTRGNGSQHAIVVLGCKGFLDLEDLASGQTDVSIATSASTRTAITLLALLWILLLITASGLRHYTWFLLAIGGIGMLFNIYVAGKRRHPKSNGLPIEFEKVIGHPKVMEALFLVEEAHPHVGRSMRDIFFPGDIRAEEEERWNNLKTIAKGHGT